MTAIPGVPGAETPGQAPAIVPFGPGDRFIYTSVTQGYEVVWTRDAAGVWTPNDYDSRGCTATDSDVIENMGDDTRLVRAGE